MLAMCASLHVIRYPPLSPPSPPCLPPPPPTRPHRIGNGNSADESAQALLVEHLKVLLASLYGGEQFIATEWNYSVDKEGFPEISGEIGQVGGRATSRALRTVLQCC